MSDVSPWREFSDEVRASTREVLFHERVHYWQLLSTSAMQHQVVNSLAHLRWLLNSMAAIGFDIFTLPESDVDLTYRGAWELWYRTNTAHYGNDPHLLALAFLAIVDLAVNPDVPARLPIMAASQSPGDLVCRCKSVPGCPPLLFPSRQLPNRFRTFKSVLCDFAVAGTRLKRPFDEANVDEIKPVFELMNEHYEPNMIGLRVLRTLINAALFQCSISGSSRCRLCIPTISAGFSLFRRCCLTSTSISRHRDRATGYGFCPPNTGATVSG